MRISTSFGLLTSLRTFTLFLICGCFFVATEAFSVAPEYSSIPYSATRTRTPPPPRRRLYAASSSSTTNQADSSSLSSPTNNADNDESSKEQLQNVQNALQNLKNVLYREYTSFFNPMERDYYASDVTFVDPMTTFTGIAKYENNVDMLAGRTLMGKILFKDAGIVLHKVEGGKLSRDTKGVVDISNIITRWTLRLTVQILPWQPTARFTGISVYTIQPGVGPRGVQVIRQDDYWDSVNLLPGGEYAAMATSQGVADFLTQLKPNNQMAAPSANSAELPYQLLRRSVDYEVRRYPAFCAVQTDYTRRDEGYAELGSFCGGSDSDAINPLAPALLQVTQQSKSMMWPLNYALPGDSNSSSNKSSTSLPPTNPAAVKKAQQDAWKEQCRVVNVPERIVAVGIFSDATIEPIVRKAHAKLVQACRRDGLVLLRNNVVDEQKEANYPDVLNFAQYDAIFSMGQRRSEVWIELDDGGHPW